MWQFISQSFFIPKPSFTDKELSDQTGKVHIVTGGYSGCGEELVKILYQKNATIYVAGRSPDKAKLSITAIQADFPNSKGKLKFLLLDLSDLSTIKKSAAEFMDQEQRLDVLTNNAGVLDPPTGSRDAQGHELQIGTNCLGPFLFTKLLLPVLQKTAQNAQVGSVRVTWASSLAVELVGPKSGVCFTSDGSPKVHMAAGVDYAQSKAGNILLAMEFAKRYGKYGIISVAYHPGNLNTDLYRHGSSTQRAILGAILLHPPVFGAYVELYAGWSPDITPEKNGDYVIPWGRSGKHRLREDILQSEKSVADGGSGIADKFYEWCEKETTMFT